MTASGWTASNRAAARTTFLAAAASLIAIRVDEPAPARGEGHWLAEVAAGLQHVRRTPVLLQMVVALALAMLFFGFAETLAYSVVTVGLHRPPTLVGPLLTVMGIGAVVGGVTAGPLLGRLPARLLFGLALILSAVTGLLLATHSLPLVMAGVIAAGLAVPWLLVSITTVLQRVTGCEMESDDACGGAPIEECGRATRVLRASPGVHSERPGSFRAARACRATTGRGSVPHRHASISTQGWCGRAPAGGPRSSHG
jgi:MFS family permease